MKDGRKRLLKYSVAILCAAAFSFLILWLNEIGDAEILSDKFKILSDAFTVPGVLLIMVGALIWTSTQGIFDGLGYSFGRIGSMFIPLYQKSFEHLTYYDYKMSKVDKRIKGYSFLFYVGIGFLVVGILFFVLYKIVYVPITK